MVSKASDDFPEPLTPVMTTNLLRGTTTSMFLRLCSRAPRMTMDSMCGDANSALPRPLPVLHAVEEPLRVGAVDLGREHYEFWNFVRMCPEERGAKGVDSLR